MNDLEIKGLEQLETLVNCIHEINGTLEQMNQHAFELIQQTHELENKMNAIYIPFQSAIYEYTIQKQPIEAVEKTSASFMSPPGKFETKKHGVHYSFSTTSPRLM